MTTRLFIELRIFGRHWQMRLEKWPLMKLFSGLYDFWRRGKRSRFYLLVDFWPKSDFRKKVMCVITKVRKIENHVILKSYEFLDITGRCVSKNDPWWNYFQVSTTSGGGVKDHVFIVCLTFGQKVTFTKSDLCNYDFFTWRLSRLTNCDKQMDSCHVEPYGVLRVWQGCDDIFAARKGANVNTWWK